MLEDGDLESLEPDDEQAFVRRRQTGLTFFPVQALITKQNSAGP